MSPRAACRLETLGFDKVYDYVPGKVDWLAHNLPTDGDHAHRLTAGQLARDDVPTVTLEEDLARIQARLQEGDYGFALVLSAQGIVLGRLRASAITATGITSVEAAMDAGSSTVRPDVAATDLLERLRGRKLTSALVTTPEGRLVGVVRRRDLAVALEPPGRD